MLFEYVTVEICISNKKKKVNEISTWLIYGYTVLNNISVT